MPSEGRSGGQFAGYPASGHFIEMGNQEGPRETKYKSTRTKQVVKETALRFHSSEKTAERYRRVQSFSIAVCSPRVKDKRFLGFFGHTLCVDQNSSKTSQM